MKTYYTLIVAACLTTIYSCNTNSPKTPSGNSATKTDNIHSQLDSVATRKIMAMAGTYLLLKDNMVAAKPSLAKTTAALLMQQVKVCNNDPIISKDSFEIALINIKEMCNKIVECEDSTCEKQRRLFGYISNDMWLIVNHIQLKNSGLYRQYCPMAFNDSGAYWLSNDPEIKNPYFGKIMLECGETVDTL
ncbi:MAG: DUF3347 domain-containing protein [Chitinophagia bacterium]|nr:DUF3347 domain-containing protein [Chitinophagia bacterium]